MNLLTFNQPLSYLLRLKGDLVDKRNTKELRRIARNKQKIARDNNICQVTKQLIDENESSAP